MAPSRSDDPPGKLKVTYIVGSLRDAGTERRTLELLRHLDRDRFVPSLILMEDTGADRARAWIDELAILELPESGYAKWATKIAAVAKAIWKARGHLKNWRSDVVHGMLPASSIIGVLAGRLAGTPIIIGSRPCLAELYRRGSGAVAFAERMTFHMATTTLGNSEAVTRDLTAAAGCPPAKCFTIRNGVDTDRFHPGLPREWRSAMGWNGDHVVFGMIANFRPYKRHADFVSAAALILRRNRTARFVLVGADFGTKSSILRQIGELGLADAIAVLDADPSPEKIFAALDVYVCTSESEGFSNVILEAMACGKPVVATNVGGNPEAVLDRVTGLLIPSGDPIILASTCELLLTDPQQRQAMGIAARQRVMQDFSLQHMVQQYENLYSRLFSRSKGKHV